MGLISKIEDKLHSDKGSSPQAESSKLQKSSYEDSGSSHLRHPVQSGKTSGDYDSSTTGAGYGSSTGGAQGCGSSTSGAQGYGSSTTAGKDYGSSTTGSSAMPGSYDDRTASVGRDGYGASSARYSSSDRRDPTTTTSSGPREPYDPYSSKGQTTAANAATGYSSRDYGGNSSGTTYANDPNVPRSREGGVMNQTDGGMSNSDPYGSSSARQQDPYATSTTNSSGHPIRDAATMGGTGAAAGAYGQHAASSTTDPQDVPYMNRSSGDNMGATTQPGGMMGSSAAPGGTTTSGMGSTAQTGGSGAPSMDPKKMGGAYEAGYRDAMEHAKEQMGLK